MNALRGLSRDQLAHGPDARLVHEGAMAEQFIGQHSLDLISDAPNRALTCWLREGRSKNAEVDYVAAGGGRIIPIGVKAGASGRLKSLHQFAAEKGAAAAACFDANPPASETIEAQVRKAEQALKARYQLHSLPLCLVERLAGLTPQALE